MGEQQEQDVKKFSRWVIAAMIAVPVGWLLLAGLFPFNLLYSVFDGEYLLACVVIPSLLAIIGIIDSCRAQRKRRGIPLAGALLVTMVLAPPPQRHHTPAEYAQSHCMSNQRQLMLALMMEFQEHGEVLPIDMQLQALQVPKKTFHCRAKKHTVLGYGLNAHVRGKALSDITDPEMIITTADGGDDDHLLRHSADIDRTRHDEKGCIASHVDGHVASYAVGAPMRLQ